MNDEWHLDQFVSVLVNEEKYAEDEGLSVQKYQTDAVHLDGLYSVLPAKFPPLYEMLVLSYRWPRSSIGAQDKYFSLLANRPGPGLVGLEDEVLNDECLAQDCFDNGYIQVGFAPFDRYDPVCFAVQSGLSPEQFPLVILDHEQILCWSKIKIIKKVAPSFRELVLQAIEENCGEELAQE